MALAAVGMVRVARRADAARALLLWYAVANVLIYSWASERFPWLVVHPLLGIILLAGLGAEGVHRALVRTRPRLAAPATVALGGVVAAALVVLAVPPVYRAPSAPHHLLSAVQSTPDLVAVRERIEARFTLAPAGRAPVVVIDTRDSATWPWAWYLRDLPVVWADLGSDPDAAVGADVVLALWADAGTLPSPATGWTEVNRYDHRSWWLPPWDDATPGQWAGWVTRREAFGGFGSLEVVELVAGRGWAPG